ncbi:MAG: P-loop NTPase [Candidatus Aenigmarchaeota archaeon]|nr:P-loop NTPase [Candidatus Aenigmarchaeota archaeon]
MSRVIGVFSGKGGVGKTTTAVNLGVALTKLGKSVILIDSNVNTPNVSLHLGMNFTPFTIQDIMENVPYISQAMYIHESGLRVIPADFSLKDRHVDISELKNHVHKLAGDADYIIMDCAPGLGTDARAAIEACSEYLIVTNPELPAVADAYKAYKAIKIINGKVLGLVVNKVNNDNYELQSGEIEDFFNEKIIGIVPEDRNVRASIQNRMPVVMHKPNSKAAKAYRKLAMHIEGAKEKTFSDILLDFLSFDRKKMNKGTAL